MQPTPGSPRRSFRELVGAACRGVDEEALLDELVAVGSVEVIDGRTVRCLSRAYVTQSQDVKQFERMGRFLANVCASVVHNVLNIDPLYFERRVHSGEPLSDSGRDKFLALAGERAQELLGELDTFLTRLGASESSESGKQYGVGIYFFEHEAGERAEADPRKPAEPTPRGPVQEIDVLAGLGNRK